MSDFNWTQFFVVGVVALLLGGILGIMIFPKEIETECPLVNETVCEVCPLVNETIIDCPKFEESLTEEEKKLIISGYLIDELYLETPLVETISDRELNLFDGEVDFDGDDYDAEEIFYLDGLKLLANKNDFEGDVYLTIPRDSISYKFVVETSLNTSSIGEGDLDDETLTFDFLGEELEILGWNGDEITFTQGEEYFLSEEESITFNDKEIIIVSIFEDSIWITVDGIGEVIDEGETSRINILEIKVKEVLYTSSSTRTSKVIIVLGDDVEIEVSNGELYEDDSIWEWIIDEHSIGLILTEEFSELDEDFSALSKNDEICLPNEYVCIVYNGVVENEEKYTFDYPYERDEVKYTRVKGNFLSGINDYNTIYISIGETKDDGIYERDGSEFVLIDNTTIELGDTESVLNITTDNIVIRDFKVNKELDSLDINNKTIWDNVDYYYRTLYGILVNDPEDSLLDNEFTITVPEEDLEGSLTVRHGRIEETIEEQETEENSEE